MAQLHVADEGGGRGFQLPMLMKNARFFNLHD
jgi:hypothetical protein